MGVSLSLAMTSVGILPLRKSPNGPILKWVSLGTPLLDDAGCIELEMTDNLAKTWPALHM